MNISQTDLSDKGRIVWIDAIKGFSAILVVLGHDLKGFQDEHLIQGNEMLAEAVTNWIYSFHMYLFFIVSGYLFYRSILGSNRTDIQARDKFRVRILDLVILYFEFNVLLWLGKFCFASFVTNKVTWKDLFCVPIEPLAMYWYLWVLIFYYAVGYFALKPFRNSTMSCDFIWLSAAFAVTFLSGHIRASRPFGILNQAAYYFAGFFLGVFFSKRGFGFIGRKWTLIVGIPFLVAATAAMLRGCWNPGSIRFWNATIAIVISVIFIRLFQWFENRRWLSPHGLAWLGGYALEIYLLQHFIIGADRRLIKLASIPVTPLTIAFCTLIEVMVPVFAGWLLRRIHLHRLIFHPITCLDERIHPR